ncbi:excalibur calcium-binding domain-containing protein [Streptomyces gardneri]|uniref:excalibur calcium-binding domain-containing protein n=1 Tax=Streptomyces gardneri TaxID=66892 RepID=UPI00367A8816
MPPHSPAGTRDQRPDRRGSPAAVASGRDPRLEAAPHQDGLPRLSVPMKVVQTGLEAKQNRSSRSLLPAPAGMIPGHRMAQLRSGTAPRTRGDGPPQQVTYETIGPTELDRNKDGVACESYISVNGCRPVRVGDRGRAGLWDGQALQ